VRPIVVAISIACAGCSLDKSGSGVDLSLGTDATVDSAASDTGSFVVDTSVDGAMDDTFVADAFVPDTFVADTEMVEVMPEAPACKTASGETLCTDLPVFPGTQTIDGDGSDFCDVGGATWQNVDADWVVPMAPPDAGKVRVRMKFGWSSIGLHGFVTVEDPNVMVNTTPANLYKGDSVEFYLAGFKPTGGRFDATNDVGAFQVIIAPPTASEPARSQIFLTGTPSGPLDASKWKAVSTATGYAVEVQIPWSDLHGMGIKSGSQVGFDVAVNSLCDTSVEHVFAVWRRKIVMMSTCGGDSSPSCDDRVWCAPKLD
jgi:hypothetical protein